MGGREPRVTKDIVLRSLQPLVEIPDEASVALQASTGLTRANRQCLAP